MPPWASAHLGGQGRRHSLTWLGLGLGLGLVRLDEVARAAVRDDHLVRVRVRVRVRVGVRVRVSVPRCVTATCWNHATIFSPVHFGSPGQGWCEG